MNNGRFARSVGVQTYLSRVFKAIPLYIKSLKLLLIVVMVMPI